MGLLKNLLYLIPVRVGRQREPDEASLIGRIATNRRSPNSGLLLLGDVMENVKDEWVGLTRRTPPGSAVLRDEDNNYRGNISLLDRFRR